MTKEDTIRLSEKRKQYVWEEWNKILASSTNPIPNSKRERIYRRLWRKARREIKS